MISESLSRPSSNSTFPKLLLLLWLCFLLRAVFYCVLLPVWEGYDEPSHFAFIQYTAFHRDLPVVSTPVSKEVATSLHAIPLSWEQRLHALPPPIYTEDSYWKLPNSNREDLQQQFRSIPSAWQTERAQAPAMYEAQQAPLYYWMMAWPLRLAHTWGLAGRVLLVRVLSVLLASLMVPIAYVAAGCVFQDQARRIAIVAVIACMPELMIDVCRAGNESLAIPVFSLLALLLLWATHPGGHRWFAAAGFVLGIGLLSKAYFVLALPAFVLVALYAAWQQREQRQSIAIYASGGLGIALVMSFAWYWRNRTLTGSWSGEINDVGAARGGTAHLLATVTHVNWIGGLTSVLVSHVWFGGWSFLKLPKPIYVIFLFGMAAAAIGLVKLIRDDRFCSAQLFVLFTVYVFFWIGLLYDMLVTYISSGVSSSTGWYLYAVVVPELLLVAWALESLLGERLRVLVLPALAAAFALIDLYGVCFMLAPYYTGLIAHGVGSESVLPANLHQLTSSSGLLLQRLVANRPVFVDRTVVGTMFSLYVISTFVLLALAFRIFRLRRTAGVMARDA